jgi:ankyrin repeat protein
MLLDTRGSSPLHLAAWAGHAEICKLLLTHPTLPADPNCLTAENETPLHFASQHGHLTTLIEMLAHGADPNIMNGRDETPLDLGAQYGEDRCMAYRALVRYSSPDLFVLGRLQVAQILIRAHNELLLPLKATSTQNSHTALHLASRNGHRDIVELLLAAGCNVNIRTPNGSALHEAAMCGKENVVKSLLREGIDLDITDCDGRTVFDLLDEFPANVVNRIRNVISNHRKSSIYDSESDDLQGSIDRYQRRGHSSSFSGYQAGSSSNSNRGRHHQHQQQHRYQEQYENYGGTTSPSSSMGSFCGVPSPIPSPAGVLVAIKPKSAPMKPPRKGSSVSPPNHPQSLHLMSRSVDFDLDYDLHHSSNEKLDGSSSTSSNQQRSQKQTTKSSKNGPYEYLHLSHSGESEDQQSKAKKTPDAEKQIGADYIIMNAPITMPENFNDKIVRVANPHRKLRRPNSSNNNDPE